MAIGRPTVLDDDVIEAYGNALDTGHTVRTACAFVGLSMQSVQAWRKQGDDDLEAGKTDTLHARFSRRYAHARANRVNRWLGVVDQIAAGAEKDSDRKASATWLLEHCEPEEFGAKSRVELTGKDDGPIQTATHIVILPAKMTVDEWQAAALTAVKNGDG
jgi:hypothetical protein